MEVKIDDAHPTKGLIVPSHENGALMIDIEELGRTSVDQIELRHIRSEAPVIVDDNARQLGLYGIINCVALVSVPVPHSHNSVSYEVKEFQELAPVGRHE